MGKRIPKNERAERIDKLGDRIKDRGPSKWDRKVHTAAGRTYSDLRYRVYLSRKGGMSTDECVRMFSVSRGFVSKWYDIGKLSEGLRGYVKASFLSLPMGIGRPRPVRDRIMSEVVDLRRKHPWMGSAKIKVYGRIDASPTTIDKVIRESGFIRRPRKRSRRTYVRFERQHSLSLIQLDFKKWPSGPWSIWALDDRSRMILGMEVTERADSDTVIRLMEGVVRRFGRPEQILTDNGAQFTSMRGSDHKFDEWCRSNGIEHVTGAVNSPETQGKIERSHRSAIDETKHLGKIKGTDNWRNTLMDWMLFYNTERPHQSLNYDVPVNVFLRDLKNQDAFLELAFTR
jgi:hypothetical protein